MGQFHHGEPEQIHASVRKVGVKFSNP